MWADIILVSLAGGLLALDRTAAFQIMISRPIVAAPVIGLILGHPLAGLSIGAMLELLWISRLPLGGHIPPNEAVTAVVASAGTILAGQAMGGPGPSIIALGILLALPLGRLASILELRLRRLNGRLLKRAEQAVAENRVDDIRAINMAGVGRLFVSAAAFILAFTIVLTALIRLIHPACSPAVLRALELAYILLPLVGVASALSTITVRRSGAIFGLLFLVALGLLGI